MIEANVIHAASVNEVKKLLFLGSSCIYPHEADQPRKEGALLSGYLEPTNEPYAVAKIAGTKLCESYNRQFGESHGVDYRSVMPVNLYGPGDNYHPENPHLIPGWIWRFHEAKVAGASEAVVRGSEKPRGEFLYVDDMARVSVFVMGLDEEIHRPEVNPMCSHINVGCGEDVTMLDGSPRKLMDSNRMRHLGWQPQVGLEEGLRKAYAEFVSQAC